MDRECTLEGLEIISLRRAYTLSHDEAEDHVSISYQVTYRAEDLHEKSQFGILLNPPRSPEDPGIVGPK